jgi:DNA-binding transcriptional MerR regulator
MRIGELASLSGVSIRALRYYEEQGLLRPNRSANGYRQFSDKDVATVAKIQLLLSAGLGSRKIADVLPWVCGSGVDRYDWPEPALVEELIPVREQMAQEIAARQESLAVLDRMITAARGSSD